MKLQWIFGFALALTGSFLLGAAVTPARGADNDTCLVCHRSPQEPSQPAKAESFYIDSHAFERSVHGSLTCDTCHQGFTAGPHDLSNLKGVDESLQKLASVLHKEGKGRGGVAIASCVMCHYDIFQKYSQSVHGAAVLTKGVKDAPYCLDCHGDPHRIMPKDNPASKAYYTNIPTTCAACHGNSEIVLKYHLNTHVVSTYRESFHGQKLILGSSKVAVCTSCHGAHEIVSPQSPAFTAGLAARCGRCHKGASPKFATAFAHIPLTAASQRIVRWAEQFFAILTGGVVLGLVTHIGLDLTAIVRERFRGRRKK